MIDCFASEPHFWSHCQPLFEGLYGSERGTLYLGRRVHNPPPEAVRTNPLPTGGPILVASFSDYRRVRQRPVVFLEHGSGQSYKSATGQPDRNPSNPGGKERESVILFLNTNESVAERNRQWYPHTPSVVVGSPKMDALLTIPRPSNESPVVALSWRWENGQTQESKSALRHYLPSLPKLAEQFTVIGHGHPRAWRHLEKTYSRLGIEPVRDFEDVVARADVLLVDNSSVGPEWMALDRPLVWLNSPTYRRSVHHGGRFWLWTEGIPTCDHPSELLALIDYALSDPPEVRCRRKEIVDEVYGMETLGRATDLGLAAMREIGREQGWLD